MTADNKTLSGMGAEVGFEAEAASEPARVSGFFSLIFGLVGSVAFMGAPMLLFPLLAVVLGLIALRRCEGAPPLGTGAAKVGLILGVGFGVFGITVPQLRIRTLSAQAERYSLEYLKLVGSDQNMLAIELKKTPHNRLPPTMSLEEYYGSNQNGSKRLASFRQVPLNRQIRAYGADAEWKLDRPPRINLHFGREQVEVVWLGPDGISQIQFFLEFKFDSSGVGQWHVETVQFHRERVVAERVL